MPVYKPPKLTGGKRFKLYTNNLEKQLASASDDLMEERRGAGDVVLKDYISYWQEAQKRPWNTLLKTQNITQKITHAKIEQFEAELDEGISAGRYTLDQKLGYITKKRDAMTQGSEAWYEAQDDINSLTERIEKKNAAAYAKQISEAKKRLRKENDMTERELADLERKYQNYEITGGVYDNAFTKLQGRRAEYFETVTANSDYFTIDQVASAEENLYELYYQVAPELQRRRDNPNAYIDVSGWGTTTVDGQEIPVFERRRTAYGTISMKTISMLTGGRVGDDAPNALTALVNYYRGLEGEMGEGVEAVDLPLPSQLYFVDFRTGDYVQANLNPELLLRAKQAGSALGIPASMAIDLIAAAGESIPLYQVRLVDGTTSDYIYGGTMDIWRSKDAATGEDIYETAEGVVEMRVPEAEPAAAPPTVPERVEGAVEAAKGVARKAAEEPALALGAGVLGAVGAKKAVGVGKRVLDILRGIPATRIGKGVIGLGKAALTAGGRRVLDVIRGVTGTLGRVGATPMGRVSSLLAIAGESIADAKVLAQIANLRMRMDKGQLDPNEAEEEFKTIITNAPTAVGTTLMKAITKAQLTAPKLPRRELLTAPEWLTEPGTTVPTAITPKQEEQRRKTIKAATKAGVPAERVSAIPAPEIPAAKPPTGKAAVGMKKVLEGAKFDPTGKLVTKKQTKMLEQAVAFLKRFGLWRVGRPK